MKVLVTGANGYLGSGVVKQLCDDGIDVIATDLKADHIDRRSIWYKADLYELDNPYEYFGQPDVIFHMAWRNGFIHNDPSHVMDLPKHYLFLKKMIDGGVKRVAVMGSMHEIGFFEGSIKADTPTHPENLYGISKNALRNITESLCRNAFVQYQWLRGYYIVGNSEFGCSVFSKIAAAEKERKNLFPFTTGVNQYDFIDYSDFCFQAASIIEQDKICGIINICSGRPEKLSDRVERFIKERNYNIKLDYGKLPDRTYDSKAVWGDSSIVERIINMRTQNEK